MQWEFSIVPERLMKKKVACACVISEAKLNRWLLAESYSACIPAQSCCWAYFLKRTQLGWGWEAQSSFYSRRRGGGGRPAYNSGDFLRCSVSNCYLQSSVMVVFVIETVLSVSSKFAAYLFILMVHCDPDINDQEELFNLIF